MHTARVKFGNVTITYVNNWGDSSNSYNHTNLESTIATVKLDPGFVIDPATGEIEFVGEPPENHGWVDIGVDLNDTVKTVKAVCNCHRSQGRNTEWPHDITCPRAEVENVK